MVNNKRKLSLEEQEFLRAEWRKQHPEEAARRDAKRKLAKEEKAKLLREKEDFEQENLVFRNSQGRTFGRRVSKEDPFSVGRGASETRTVCKRTRFGRHCSFRGAKA